MELTLTLAVNTVWIVVSSALVFIMHAGFARITSYNVCYTKLLRGAVAAESARLYLNDHMSS